METATEKPAKALLMTRRRENNSRVPGALVDRTCAGDFPLEQELQ